MSKLAPKIIFFVAIILLFSFGLLLQWLHPWWSSIPEVTPPGHIPGLPELERLQPHRGPTGPTVTWFGLLPQTVGQIVFTAFLLAASLFVILSRRYAPPDRHWAYATIGTLVGYWLKGPSGG